MVKITWLASYPKSGNTWIRCFLRAYQYDAYEPININQIGKITKSACRRAYFQHVAKQKELSSKELRNLRHEVQQWLCTKLGAHQVVKTHFKYDDSLGPIASPNSSAKAIYIIRNPLDVAISFSDHFGTSIDIAIQRMNQSSFMIGGVDKEFVPQLLGTWREHVESWTIRASHDMPILVIRYEDLLCAPGETFDRILKFLGWYYDPERLQRAIQFSSFDMLKQTESARGFIETSARSTSGSFFRSGKCGEWQNFLEWRQMADLLAVHGPTMCQFGYVQR